MCTVMAWSLPPTRWQVTMTYMPLRSAARGTIRVRVTKRARVRDDVATSLAVDTLVREAKPISVEQAQARQKLWTPEQEGKQGSGQLWTPGS